ncbi:MAG: right-handed parallel beta-helix repeat-containing protein, partial [Candidatus Eremiobacterota bacterium]
MLSSAQPEFRMGPGGDLEAELGRLPDGACLALAPGRYRLDGLAVRRALRLFGAGSQATVLEGSLHIEGCLELFDLAVEHDGEYCVEVRGGELRAERCRFNGAAQAGVSLSGESRARIRWCELSGCERGLVVQDRARLEVQASRLLDNRSEG